MTLTPKNIAILAAAVLAAAFIGGKACDVAATAKLNRLRGEYAEKLRVADAAMKDGLAMITAQAAAIEQAKADVAAIGKERDALKADIGAVNVALVDAKAKVAASEALPATIENLTHTIVLLHGEVTLLETAIEKERTNTSLADAQATKWQFAYDAEVIVSAKWNEAYNREHALRLTADEIAKVTGRRVTALRVTSTVKSVLVIAAGAYFGYLLTQKGK
jgi:hypothetical protein